MRVVPLIAETVAISPTLLDAEMIAIMRPLEMPVAELTLIDVAPAEGAAESVVFPVAVAPMTRRKANVVPTVGALVPVSIWHQTIPWMTVERSTRTAAFWPCVKTYSGEHRRSGAIGWSRHVGSQVLGCRDSGKRFDGRRPGGISRDGDDVGIGFNGGRVVGPHADGVRRPAEEARQVCHELAAGCGC